MKYLARELKGTFGYIRKQTIFEIIKTVVLFAMAFGIFMIGYTSLGTKRSLWSVFAVLALLPASKSLVGVIMLLRFRSLSAAEYDRLRRALGNIPAIYENVVTTSSRAYFIPVICCAHSSVTAYMPAYDKELNTVKTHIENVLAAGGHKATVKIFDDENDFLVRAKELNEKSSHREKSCEAILETLKAVSL